MIVLPSDEPWPHQFTKNGKGYELPDGSHAQTYICVHCYQEYVQNIGNLKMVPEWVKEPCKARRTKREMIRLKNGG